MNRSIGVFGHERFETAGIAGLRSGCNDQWFVCVSDALDWPGENATAKNANKLANRLIVVVAPFTNPKLQTLAVWPTRLL